MGKIAFITATVNRGGASKVLSILANHYVKLGWDVDFLIKESIINGYPLASTIRIIEFGKANCGHGLRFARAIRNYLKIDKPDVMVSFLTVVNLYTIIANIGIGCKLIVSERNDPMYSGGRKLFALSKLLYGAADSIIFQSQKVMEYYPKNIRRKGHVILNPIEICCDKQLEDKPKIVTAGRFVKQKNHKILLYAFEEVHRKHPEYELVIYGDGPLKKEYEKCIENLGITDCVTMPGNVLELHTAISDARVFALSSDYEGLSNSLLEAMMMGLACVSTKSGGIEEIINKKTGILVNTKDEEALVDALLKMIEDEPYRKLVEKEAKKFALGFKKKNVICEWEQVIENV